MPVGDRIKGMVESPDGNPSIVAASVAKLPRAPQSRAARRVADRAMAKKLRLGVNFHSKNHYELGTALAAERDLIEVIEDKGSNI